MLRLNGGNLSSTGTVTINGGALSGNGTVSGNVAMNGQLDLGPAVGTRTVADNYTQASTGTLSLKLGGATAGTFDHLAVSGAATLAGTLALTRTGGYSPVLGDSLGVITCGSCSGTFGTVTGAGIDSTKHFGVTYGAGGVTLTVVAGMAPAQAGAADPSITALFWPLTLGRAAPPPIITPAPARTGAPDAGIAALFWPLTMGRLLGYHVAMPLAPGRRAGSRNQASTAGKRRRQASSLWSASGSST